MAGSVYADTSWIAKLYLYEVESADCIACLNTHRGDLYVSPLGNVEITAAICKAHRDSPERAARALVLYREDCGLGFLKKLAIDEQVFTAAEEIAERHSAALLLRSLDILHVATAKRHGITSIASFDKRLREAALALGLAVVPA